MAGRLRELLPEPFQRADATDPAATVPGLWFLDPSVLRSGRDEGLTRLAEEWMGEEMGSTAPAALARIFLPRRSDESGGGNVESQEGSFWEYQTCDNVME